MMFFHNHYKRLGSFFFDKKEHQQSLSVDLLALLFVDIWFYIVSSFKLLSLFFCNIHLNFFRIMKQQNVLFSGRSLVLFLGLIVQLLLSQTASAQKAQVPVKSVGGTPLMTTELINAPYVAPAVATTRLATKINELYQAAHSGAQVDLKIQYYEALKSAIENGITIYNAIGEAGKKIDELPGMDRATLAQYKDEARALLSI